MHRQLWQFDQRMTSHSSFLHSFNKFSTFDTMQSQSENATQNDQSVQPSFDEVVELISTGRADQIPGIKDIPLKINEATPSAPTMSRPAKPWERATEQQEINVNSQSEQNDMSINANNTQVSQS